MGERKGKRSGENNKGGKEVTSGKKVEKIEKEKVLDVRNVKKNDNGMVGVLEKKRVHEKWIKVERKKF